MIRHSRVQREIASRFSEIIEQSIQTALENSDLLLEDASSSNCHTAVSKEISVANAQSVHCSDPNVQGVSTSDPNAEIQGIQGSEPKRGVSSNQPCSTNVHNPSAVQSVKSNDPKQKGLKTANVRDPSPVQGVKSSDPIKKGFKNNYSKKVFKLQSSKFSKNKVGQKVLKSLIFKRVNAAKKQLVSCKKSLGARVQGVKKSSNSTRKNTKTLAKDQNTGENSKKCFKTPCAKNVAKIKESKDSAGSGYSNASVKSPDVGVKSPVIDSTFKSGILLKDCMLQQGADSGAIQESVISFDADFDQNGPPGFQGLLENEVAPPAVPLDIILPESDPSSDES